MYRQARLRPAFSDWYPRITPGKWHHALWVREMALAGLRKGGPHWEIVGRILSDRHFEFQGGERTGDQGEERRLLAPGRPGAGSGVT